LNNKKIAKNKEKNRNIKSAMSTISMMNQLSTEKKHIADRKKNAA
jgi:hypothetical protein